MEREKFENQNSTLCNGCEYGGLKNVDIFPKVVCL